MRALELARDARDLGAESRGLWTAFYSAMALGLVQEAHAHATRNLECARMLQLPAQITEGIAQVQYAACATGSWESARSWSDQLLERTPHDSRALFDRALLEGQAGNKDLAASYRDRALQSPELQQNGSLLASYSGSFIALQIPALCRNTGSQKGFELAAAIAREVLAAPLSMVARYCAGMALGLMAVLRGDTQTCAEQYDELRAVPRVFLSRGGFHGERFLGLLAAGAGRMDDALSHFETSLESCRTAGWSPELAWTCFDYAETLARLGGSVNRARAATLLEEGLTIAADLGMPPLEGFIQESRRSLDAYVDPEKPSYPDGLTEREVDVLRLVAQGLTNKEIGDRLFIAVKTVSTHIANLYGKAGIANRAEATAYAIRNGLAGS